MTPTVRLLQAGGGRVPQLEGVFDIVGAALGLPVRLERLQPDLGRAQDRSRRQYNSTALLEQLIAMAGAAHEKRIAIVDVDLFIPVLSFVFGEAQLSGQAAVVSTYRLDNVLYGLPRDDGLLAARLGKEIVHELGHTLGLYHCRQFECVMRSSTYVEEIDLKQDSLCPACRELLSGHLESRA